MICEKCWADAELKAALEGGTVTDRYFQLLEERKDNPCKLETVPEPESHTVPQQEATK